MIHPTEKEFFEKAKQGNVIPVVKEILADAQTPISAYIRVAQGEYSFLLESVEGNERVGRFSFLGSSPRWIFSSKGNKITFQEGKKRKSFQSDDALAELKKLFTDYQVVKDASLPRFFGGAVGYVGYGAVQQFEKIPQNKKDDLNLPDLYFFLADTLIAFDHVEHRIKIIANAFVNQKGALSAYRDALKRIEKIEKSLSKVKQLSSMEWVNSEADMNHLNITSNCSQDEFEKSVEHAKEYIKSGDIFQVVLSQRFCLKRKLDPVKLYRALRSVNPSPYMFLLKFKDFYLVGTSPEIHVRCEDGKVELRPIAGTRRRGKTVEEDARLQKELLNDPKERAEHLMLVDLGRNDLGRVCEYATVKVPELMVIEKYSHVMHIVSDVVGNLAHDKDALDVLRATFPAGTVSGAPKIRAMQIIEELEKNHRGTYAGAIGYYSFSGDLDSCIAIRTILLKKGVAYIQAGAGIVADSVPAQEYQETVNKVRGMMKAIAVVEGQNQKARKA